MTFQSTHRGEIFVRTNLMKEPCYKVVLVTQKRSQIDTIDTASNAWGFVRRKHAWSDGSGHYGRTVEKESAGSAATGLAGNAG